MRRDRKNETISDWYGNEPRMRNDAFDYVAAALAGELHKIIGKQPLDDSRRAKKTIKDSFGPRKRSGPALRPRAPRTVWLTAAE
jgi:hypothetical protein